MATVKQLPNTGGPPLAGGSDWLVVLFAAALLWAALSTVMVVASGRRD
jgi:hypothetical protein